MEIILKDEEAARFIKNYRKPEDAEFSRLKELVKKAVSSTGVPAHLDSSQLEPAEMLELLAIINQG